MGDWGGDYGAIENKVLVFDLGGLFNIDRVRFYPREKHLVDRFIETFIVGINDGDPLKDGTPGIPSGREVGQATARRPERFCNRPQRHPKNTRSDIVIEMPDRPVRNILFEAPANIRGRLGKSPNLKFTVPVLRRRLPTSPM